MRSYTLTEDVEIMEKLGVGPYQLFLLKTLFEAEADRVPIYKSTRKMKELGLLDLDALADLITKGIIEDFNKLSITGTPEFFMDYVELTPKAMKALNISSFKAMELMRAYPRLLEINGKSFSLVNVGETELSNTYARSLEITDYTHEQVMELVKWAKENNCLNVGLKKFSETHYWLTIEEMKKSGKGNVGSVTVEML